MECLMDHIVLNVEDDEKVIAFYTEVLKFEPERLAEYHRGEVPFPSVRLNANTVIDLFPKKMWRKNQPAGQCPGKLNHFCLAMKKQVWQELLERLQEKGVHIEAGPVLRWGAHGTGTSAYFRDPEGNLIEARYYEEQNPPGKCLLGS